MKKLISATLLMLLSSSVLAEVNEWTMKKEDGSRFFYLRNMPEEKLVDHQGIELHIYCTNEKPTIKEDDNGIIVSKGGENFANFLGDEYLSLSIDGGKRLKPPLTTTSKEDAETWNKIVKEVSKANRIEAFKNNTKIATFSPIQNNGNKISGQLLECKAVRDMKRWNKKTESWSNP
ncbi:hypothetical protein A7P53_00130 [Acinetobacter defluvii]|uniref:hypothetical protein n=1 Tax=Acinetobacter defluvii TaxID=1871111 RepID=UPI00148F8603|nr:hypothetical protein [Acinetobacter defluvii]NNP71300.1 hypothetical protein [Acinetobacter defluvii]